MIELILGGARSGKSALAERRAAETGDEVNCPLLAFETATPLDCLPQIPGCVILVSNEVGPGIVPLEIKRWPGASTAGSRRRRYGGGMKRLCLSLLGALACLPARGEIVVTDVSGTAIKLAAPARRIVSLAPHITELLFAAGAGSRVVGNVEYGNYPPAAGILPKVGNYGRLDLEAIAALKPDLVLGWESGNAPASVARLRALGLAVHLSETHRIEDIAGELERIGLLAGTGPVADAAARAFRERHAALTARYSRRPPVAVFYQIWKQPLMTVNGKQIISDALSLCGGRNVFAHLPILAPTVTVEAVIAVNPEVIVASGMGDARPEWLDDWRRWTTLEAVVRDNLYFVPPDLLQRHTPRILDGAEKLCMHLEAARAKRGRQVGADATATAVAAPRKSAAAL